MACTFAAMDMNPSPSVSQQELPLKRSLPSTPTKADSLSGRVNHKEDVEEAPHAPGVAREIDTKNASRRLSAQSQNGGQANDGKEQHLPDSGPSCSSVQVARDDDTQLPSYSKPSSVVDDTGDPTSKGKQSLLTKLKAFAPPFTSHSRTSSVAADARHSDIPASPTETTEFGYPNHVEEGSDVDADAEESDGGERRRRDQPRPSKKKKNRLLDANVEESDDGEQRRDRSRSRPSKKQKKNNRQKQQQDDNDPSTALSTPKAATGRRQHFAPFDRSNFFIRRANTTDFLQHEHHHREGVSEDEGREMLNREPTWRRRSTWLPGADDAHHAGRQSEAHTDHEERRPKNLRRLTGFAGPTEYAEGLAASWRRHRADRNSVSNQRWRQLKAGLKLIGQRRKADNTVDHVKSAELLAELASGVPAALILASMFQRDEHGNRRVPILLEQLKVKVTDSRMDSHFGDRHIVFKIELEYGSGLTRMKWVIHRSLRDFANLHLKYKLHFGTQKYIQLKNTEGGQHLPRLPKSVFPYLRGVRGLESDGEEEDETAYDTTGEATSGNEKASKKKKQHQPRLSFGSSSRRKSTAGHPHESNADEGTGRVSMPRKETYPEHQRKKLELYLQKMIRFLIFRPDSNRLCRFLELSALGVRLAAEGSYHGKEGYMVIQSSTGLDFRKTLNPSRLKQDHSPKWFLVRHSYVVCVDSPEEMNVYDVFLVDPFFKIQTQRMSEGGTVGLTKSARESARHPQHHTLRLENSERKLRMLARNERQLHQFEDSIVFMATSTPWSKPNRFDSFAPVRRNCFAQWMVDGRDHMWLVSRAINQAKDVIYIHDWWLSPELYMRRPAAISQKWRLDRLLQKKAREGVKIFIIMYRNINSAIPIDSEYSKFSLLDLHPNVFVQRSPNQFRQNTFFWAHHEKLCVVDHTLAFVGGIDLCFGRWDTPQHTLADDKPTGFEATGLPRDADHCQLWPGKDYSNPRVQDFYDLYKPYEEMYDRNVIPRMPWHDISMHIVGQPARDLTRHFVQRWNYILRQRKPTRPTPLLLPPPDFNAADLEALDLDGTCEIQLLRSSSTWSTGTPNITEHSIMNAYVKMIEESEHFVHIENQFFISTCDIDGRKIENRIGDALVERIIRAHKEGQTWRAVIIIPLMPGFQNTVDSEGGTSVRLIMQCQYRSICRGDTSLFGRLRAHGVEPEDYIRFFSLRAWGKIGVPKRLVTEQLYIHAKCMIVDDRVAIIGSANINERSMLGSRDSEVAAIVRDTDMIWSTMDRRPYLVGRFPHTLRMRLMREHLGIDVDEVMEEDMAVKDELDRMHEGSEDATVRQQESDSEQKQDEREMIERRHRLQDAFLTRSENLHSFNHDVDWEQSNNPHLKTNKKLTVDPRVTGNQEHKRDVKGSGADHLNRATQAGFGDARDSRILNSIDEVLVSPVAAEGKGTLRQPKMPSPASSTHEQGLQSNGANQKPQSGIARDSDSAAVVFEGENSGLRRMQSPTEASESAPQRPVGDPRLIHIDKNCMKDPVNDAFYLDTWLALAEKNTMIFRSVFRCMPDSEVKSWKQYKEYAAYGERFEEMQTQHNDNNNDTANSASKVPTPLRNAGDNQPTVTEEKMKRSQSGEGQTPAGRAVQQIAEMNRVEGEVLSAESSADPSALGLYPIEEKSLSRDVSGTASGELDEGEGQNQDTAVDYSDALNLNATTQAWRRKRRVTHIAKELHSIDDVMDLEHAERILSQVQGHLVLWPYEWFVSARFLSCGSGFMLINLNIGWKEKNRAEIGFMRSTKSPRWKYSKLHKPFLRHRHRHYEC